MNAPFEITEEFETDLSAAIEECMTEINGLSYQSPEDIGKLIAIHREFLDRLPPAYRNSRDELGYLSGCLDKAETIFANGEVHKVAFIFFMLGQLSMRNWLPPMEEQLDLMDRQITLLEEKKEYSMRKQKQERGIRRGNVKNVLLKEEARKIANSVWTNDLENELSIGEVADYVIGHMTAKLDEENVKLIPQNASMRKWIRHVAPEYATKPGRPKKN